MAFRGGLFLLVVLWDTLSAKNNDFCVEQPEAMHVSTGGFVIIPCTFSYPRELNPIREVSVYWRAGDGDRCGNSEFIYNHTEHYTSTSSEYKGRITLAGDPRNRSGSIRIGDLWSSDGNKKYCCRINITLSNGTIIGWQNRHMTQLVFADAAVKSRVEQLDTIPAHLGTFVTIPCKFTYSEEMAPTMNIKIYWKAGYEDLCLTMRYIYNETNNYMHGEYQGRVKLVSDPRGTGKSSLQIKEVTKNDSKRYCCVVQFGINRGEWLESTHGTELIVGDAKSNQGFIVTQPNDIAVQYNETISMNCSFTYPKNMDPLWIGVYWTVGEKWTTFVYHHSQESVDPTYRGRTQLIGNPEYSSTVSLKIHNFKHSDNGTYYCLVAFRFCNGSNGFTSVIQQGAGIMIPSKEDGTMYWVLIVAIMALLLIVIIIVIILKKKGEICKGASIRENSTSSGEGVHVQELADEKDPPRPDYFNGNHKPKEEVPVVYAALDLSNPVHVGNRAQPDPQNNTVYSAVRTK